MVVPATGEPFIVNVNDPFEETATLISGSAARAEEAPSTKTPTAAARSIVRGGSRNHAVVSLSTPSRYL